MALIDKPIKRKKKKEVASVNVNTMNAQQLNVENQIAKKRKQMSEKNSL